MKILNFITLTFSFASLILASCNITNDYKNAKIETVIENVKQSNSLRTYDECLNDGYEFDNLASSKKDQAISLYNKSAKILTDCDELIEGNSYLVNNEDRMKNFALSIQNFIKAGDIENGKKNLIKFKKIFDKDLTYKDGSSFIENIETLLNYSNPENNLNSALINNSKIIKSELRRIQYWSKN